MKSLIKTIAITAALTASNIFAATDYIIQITENDGTVRVIPVSNLDKITFETASTTIEIKDPIKAMDNQFAFDKIHATQIKVPTKVAEKMLKNYNKKRNEYEHKI